MKVHIVILLFAGVIGGLIFNLIQYSNANENNFERDLLSALSATPNSHQSYDVSDLSEDLLFALGLYGKVTLGDSIQGPPYLSFSASDSVIVVKRLNFFLGLKGVGFKVNSTNPDLNSIFIDFLRELLQKDTSLSPSKIFYPFFLIKDQIKLSVKKGNESILLGLPYWSANPNHFIRNYFRIKGFGVEVNSDSMLTFIHILQAAEKSEAFDIPELLHDYIKLRQHAQIQDMILGVDLFGDLQRMKKQVILASLGSLPEGNIPAKQVKVWYKDKEEFLLYWYFVFTIWTILLGFVPHCYGFGRDNNDFRKFYNFEWGKPIVYLHILFWLPGLFVWTILWGVSRIIGWVFALIFTDHLSKQKVRAVEKVMKKTHDIEQEETSTNIDDSTVWLFVDICRIADRIPENAYIKLAKLGIPISDTKIKTRQDETLIGITFPEEHWQTVFSEFGIKPINIRKTDLQKDNIVLFDYDDPEGFLAEKQIAFKSRKEEFSNQFVVECLKGVTNDISYKENQMSLNSEEIKEAMRRIAENNSENDTLMGEIAMLTEELSKERFSASKLHVDFKQLCDLEHVVTVEVEPGTITVFTDALKINHIGATYYLGEYKITINTDDNSIKWENLFNAAGGRHHPYGTCLGNIASATAQLLAKRDYLQVVHILLKFLQSVHGSYASSLKHWKVM